MFHYEFFLRGLNFERKKKSKISEPTVWKRVFIQYFNVPLVIYLQYLMCHWIIGECTIIHSLTFRGRILKSHFSTLIYNSFTTSASQTPIFFILELFYYARSYMKYVNIIFITVKLARKLFARSSMYIWFWNSQNTLG